MVFGTTSWAEMPVRSYNKPVDAQKHYLEPLPHIPIEASCDCFLFVKKLGAQIVPVDKPLVGYVIHTLEGPTGHWMMIIKDEGDSWIVIESNYVPCSLTIRRIPKDYPLINGYYK